jgi:hypothetical protein
MDPRARITPLGLTQQFRLATKIVDLMNRSYAAIAPLARQSAEGATAASPQPPASSLLSDLKTLNADFATAYDVVESADRAPTAQAVKAVAVLEQRLKKLLLP